MSFSAPTTSASPNNSIVKLLHDLITISEENKARKGLHRMRMIEELLKKQYYSPIEIYQLLNPSELEAEVFDSKIRDTDKYRRRINLLTIIPLTITWLSLSYAVWSYQMYTTAFPNEITTPFLILWQQGFGGRDPFSFASTGLIDFGLLSFYLVNQFQGQRIEHKAQKNVNKFSIALDKFVIALLDRQQPSDIAIIDTTDITQAIPQITMAIRDVLNTSLKANYDFMNSAKEELEKLRLAHIEDRAHASDFVKQIDISLQNFTGDIKTLDDKYIKLNDELKMFTSRIEQYANQFAGIKDTLESSITKLDTTVSNMQMKLTATMNTLISDAQKTLQQTATQLTSVIQGFDAHFQQEFANFNGEIHQQNVLIGHVAGEIRTNSATLTSASASVNYAVNQMTASLLQMQTILNTINTQVQPSIITMSNAVTQSATDLSEMSIAINEATKKLKDLATQTLMGKRPRQFFRNPFRRKKMQQQNIPSQNPVQSSQNSATPVYAAKTPSQSQPYQPDITTNPQQNVHQQQQNKLS